MTQKNQTVIRVLLAVLLALGMVSCASIPELKVLYRLPPSSSHLKDKKVSLVVEDARKTKALFGQGAKKDFGNYLGNISLSVARQNEAGFKIGPFQLPEMVKEAFKRRLENEGVEVLSERTRGEPRMLIIMNEFVVDLVGRKWTAKMGYEARLMKQEDILARQIVEGEAERLKLIGRKDADTVTGEIFTDMVNRLDLLKLFKQANLL